jgi:hypothetical protein
LFDDLRLDQNAISELLTRAPAQWSVMLGAIRLTLDEAVKALDRIDPDALQRYEAHDVADAKRMLIGANLPYHDIVAIEARWRWKDAAPGTKTPAGDVWLAFESIILAEEYEVAYRFAGG